MSTSVFTCQRAVGITAATEAVILAATEAVILAAMEVEAMRFTPTMADTAAVEEAVVM